MIAINYFKRGSQMTSKTGKAIRVKIQPYQVLRNFENPNGTISENHFITRKSKFIWIPKSAIISIDGFQIIVKSWFLDISDDLKQIIEENKDLVIIAKGSTLEELYKNELDLLKLLSEQTEN